MSIQDRVNALAAAQGTPAEDHLLELGVVSCVPHRTGSAGRNRVYAVELDGGYQAYLKPFGEGNINAALTYGHHPDEGPANEATAWRLAEALGTPVADIVAPCVLRKVAGKEGSLSARRYGVRDTGAPFRRAPDQCVAAAFFDSLIGQQDRHRGNYRWHERAWMQLVPHRWLRKIEHTATALRRGRLGLGLIDHGYAFARPGSSPPDYCHSSEFVRWRRLRGRQALTAWERDALQRLVRHPTHLGLASYLEAERAQPLIDRAERMLQRNKILQEGEW
jgi:hypothetical protein